MNEEIEQNSEDELKKFKQLYTEYTSGCDKNPNAPGCNDKKKYLNNKANNYRRSMNWSRAQAIKADINRRRWDYRWRRNVYWNGWRRNYYWWKEFLHTKWDPIEWWKWGWVSGDRTAFNKANKNFVESCSDNPDGKGCAEMKEKIISEYNTVISNMVNNKIKPTYNETTKLRNELDDKVRELNKYQEGFGDKKVKFQRTMQMSLLWTVLATCLLFYLFKQL